MIDFDKDRFALAIKSAEDEECADLGIGTLGEKLLHKTVKIFIEPSAECREKRAFGFVADICNENGIFEVQTRSFDRLKPKIEKCLGNLPITVVYPLVSEKRILWLNSDSGEIEEIKKSPRPDRPCDALAELSKIGDYIGKEGFSVILIFVSADELRILDGWDKTRKKRATKLNIHPCELKSIIEIKDKSDLSLLIPEGLPPSFEAKDFYKKIRRKGRGAFYALKLMTECGIFRETGKRQNAKIYEISKKE